MGQGKQIILTIDVGHPPRRPELVEFEINDALSKIKNSPSLRILKIIHGRSGTTKGNVRNWLYRSRRSIKEIIYGENYNLFDKTTQLMRMECGEFLDHDLGHDNTGITLVWVR